ncbi:unnamed protein product [Owenia fusiformis]|uniref:Phosphatidic acid phosphatase type 2/haloperoxidase domain-containing protein n=1 Tax=Owenia fusiformis TaxID=6347 RepID=A0A8J1Y325_OWEFU|nr:unnamed protein product [Owenia fusiformis]
MRRTNQGRNQNSKSEDINDEDMRKCSNEKERGGSVQNQFGEIPNPIHLLHESNPLDPIHLLISTFGDGNQFGLLVWDTELSRNFAVCADSGSKYGYLRPVMKCLEYSGHGVPWIAGTIFAILATHQLKLHVTLINFLAALFVDLFIVGVLKGIVRRPRPTYNKKEDMMTIATDVFSFPSGHAVRAVFVTIFFISYLGLPFYSAMVYLVAKSSSKLFKEKE